MKLFDWLLAVYPRGFRERFGAGMRAAFTEDYARARARGRLAGLLFVTTTIPRALYFGFVERLPRASDDSIVRVGRCARCRAFPLGHTAGDRRGHFVAGAWNRREYRTIFDPQQPGDQATASSRTAAAGDDWPHRLDEPDQRRSPTCRVTAWKRGSAAIVWNGGYEGSPNSTA